MAGVDEWGALLPGQRIAGYEIKRKLGQGGFGIAYEAYNADLKARAAIKEFFPRDMVARSGTKVSVREGESQGFYERFLARFVDEARAVHHLDHPGIVKVRHFERANNTAYVVMDYIDGMSLKAWLGARQGKPGEADLEAVFAPILDALAYVHGQNLLHRDISPSNVMVDKAGKPWLIDFGAFKEMWQEQPRRTSLLAANPAYAPPEQSDAGAGHDHGPFTDIFALAATMYEGIAGRKPVPATARMAQLTFGRADPLAPLDGHGPVACRPEVIRAVMRGLSLKPEARPQTVATFKAELGWESGVGPLADPDATARWQAGQEVIGVRPLAAASVSSYEHSGQGSDPRIVAPRRRSGAWLTGVVVLALGAAIIAGVLLLRQPIADWMAESEYARIASSTEITVFEEFQSKHPGTNAARKAEARVADLKRQQADAAAERDRQIRDQQRQARHAAAASEWARIEDSTDEGVIERFIAAHADTPAEAEAKVRLADLKRQREARERSATAAAEWVRIRTTGDETVLERFIAAHPGTPAADEAKARLAEVRREKVARAEAERQRQARITAAAAEWSRIKDTTDEGVIERFIAAYGDTPSVADARTLLAEVRRAKAAAAEAARQRKARDDAAAYYNRGIAHRDKKDYDRAIADFNEAIRLDPSFANAYINRGFAHGNKKDYDRAIADFNEAIRLDPSHATAFSNRGFAHRAKKDYDRAIADYSEAIRLDPSQAATFNNRGIAHHDKKDYDRAIADYSEAIRLDPSPAIAYRNRGVTYEVKGDRTRAIEDYRRALQLDPSYEIVRGDLRRLGVEP